MSFADRLTAQRAHSRITAAKARYTELRQGMDLELTEARKPRPQDDVRYSDVGLKEEREKRAEEVRARYAEDFTRLRAQVEQDHAIVTQHLEGIRPTIGNDAAALMRSQVKWDQVRMRVEAGMPMSRVLAGADAETAVAIREWAPAWLEAQYYSSSGRLTGEQSTPFDPSGLLRSIDDRLVEVVGGDLADATHYARDAEMVRAATAPLLKYAVDGARGVAYGSGLSEALASRLGEAEAASRYTDPELAAEPVADVS